MGKYKKQLTQYVNDMQKEGYSIESIQQQLHNHGHAKQVVEETITEVKAPKKKPARAPRKDLTEFEKQKLLRGKERFFILLYFAGMIIFIFWLTAANQTNFSKVFLSFTPTLATIILVIIVLESALQSMRAINWIIPILASVIFYVLVVPNNSPALRNIDATNLTVANFILSIAFVILLEAMISGYEKKTDKRKEKPQKTTTKTKTTKTLEIEQKAASQVTFQPNKQLEEYIQAVEDKCKAINFVIGRVYSNKHGGSPELRDSIKINSEWYNEFSKADMTDMENLKKALWLIYDRLILLGKKENHVFKDKEVLRIKGLTRDNLGDEKVIEVLANNDKDPVATYYKSAVDFCRKATDELNKR